MTVSTERPPTSPLAPACVGGATAALLLAAALFAMPCHAGGLPAAPRAPVQPDRVYGELFAAVQSAQVYPDQKTFADAVPKSNPAAILREYRAQKGRAGFSLREFVDRHFTAPADTEAGPPPAATLRAHIDALWPVLTRTTTTAPAHSSLLPLPRPYVVPGGRFREGYYWDSYFTMLGLQESGHERLVDDMLENFAHEIDAYGHVPNGNRSYYLSRSQPPFFALMVELAAQVEGDAPYRRFLPELRKEHAYWMRGAAGTAPGHANARVVVLADGSLLNRYWDDVDTPRPESWLQDVTTARQVPGRPPGEVWRDLRAAAESGWDFSSRWFAQGSTDLTTIRTTAIVPVDLNSLMFQMEKTIARACAVRRERACVAEFTQRAERRALAIDHWLWHPDGDGGYYADYDWRLARVRDDRTAAMLMPLFVELAPTHRARGTLREAEATPLQVGGLAATTVRSGQQWDAPNGWAPSQWIAVQAATHYARPDLARAVGERFLGSVRALYADKHKLVEKYLVDGSGVGGGGGEYALQDGFGWTNGVTLKLLDLQGRDDAAAAR